MENTRRSLDQSYTTHKILERISNKIFTIEVNGRCINIQDWAIKIL